MLVFIAFSWLWSQVFFEGYMKLTEFGKHVGFSVTRAEQQKDRFRISYLLQFQNQSNFVIEAYVTLSDLSGKPLEIRYLSETNQQKKGYKAKYLKDDLWEYEPLEPGPKKILKKKLSAQGISKPTELFFSSSLNWILTRLPLFQQNHVTFEYQAIEEESFEPVQAKLQILDWENYQGLRVKRILNYWKGVKFVALITAEGVPVFVEAPTLGLQSVLTSKAVATKGFPLMSSVFEPIFGSIPTGSVHPLTDGVHEVPQEPNLKSHGLDPGSVIIKPQKPSPKNLEPKAD